MNDQKKYSEYPKDIATKLNEAKNVNPIGMCYFQINDTHYAVDFSRMIQMNIKTRHTRKILCMKSCLKKEHQVEHEPVPHTHQTDSSFNQLRPLPRVQWYYRGDRRILVPYSSQDSARIEAMFQNPTLKQNVIISSRTYKFDFERMKQVNSLTGYKRDIKREEMSLSQDSVNASHLSSTEDNTKPTLPITEYYINFRGLKVHLQEAKQRISEALKTMCVSKVVQLPVSTTHDLVQKLNSIARSHHVNSRAGQDARHSSKFCDIITIEGEEHLVHKAVTELQQEIITFQSQAVHVKYPPEWEPFSTTAVEAELFELKEHSTEWKQVARMFQDTVIEADLVSIKRIQNKWLWEKYTQAKKRMHQKNSGTVNEKDLWHGSKTNAEDIYDSEEGFDVRFSSQGMWGRATYFAADASYSVKYARTRDDHTKELLLAKVLTGDSFESPPDSTLRMPPEKLASSNSEVKLKQVRYDSVNGVTRNCRVYMTYSNDKAYPAYLVQFSMTQRLSTSFTSRSHAVHTPLTSASLPGFVPRNFYKIS